MTNAAYAPPPDASGGYILIKYANATDSHKMRVHVAPFLLNGWTGAVQGGASVDYPYTGTQGSGTEPTIAATFAALVAELKASYNNAWTFSLDSLYQVVNGEPTLVPVPPNPTPVVGSGPTATGIIDRYTEQILNFRTNSGHRARLVMIALGGASTLGAAMIPNTNPIVGYLTGAVTAIRAHDGSTLLAPAHATYAQNRRLRRHFAQA
jgi:hypothetical protein